ncbi:MAG: mechanosensitive ion channel [Gemmatimonadota bacterium]|jgi:small conductance mechanosensitive channel
MQLELSQAFDAALAKVGAWIEALIQNLPDIAAAVVVLVLFWIAARALRSVSKRVMDRATDHGPVKSLVGKTIYLLVLATGVMVALGILELDKTVTSILAGVGILGLALGFAFQDLAENFIAGVMMTIRRPFTDGDLVQTGDHFGLVDTIDLRATTLRLGTGQLVRIPNSDVFGNALVNYSATGERRVDVACGVSYADDLEKAGRVALDAVAGVPGRDETRDPALFWEEFGGSSINFLVTFWIPFGANHGDWLEARSRAIVAIKQAFDAEGVGIPFPILTLDFSDVGGRRLKEELQVLEGGRA